MAAMMNFTYNLYRREDTKWGSVTEDSVTTGMLWNLVEGEADMIAAPFQFSFLRREFVDYLPSMGADKLAIFIRKEQDEVVNWDTFVNAFAIDLWVVLIVSAFIFATWMHFSMPNTSSGMYPKVKEIDLTSYTSPH